MIFIVIIAAAIATSYANEDQVAAESAVADPSRYKPQSYPKPSYQPKYDQKYPQKYEDIPACAKTSGKPWCLQDSEYPNHDVIYALEQHYDAVLALYKDQVLDTKNSVDGLYKITDETYLCPSATSYVYPLRAKNTDGKWRVIVNKVEARYYKFDQSTRLEECKLAGANCPLVPECYESKCVQKNVYHRFLVYDPYDTYFPFAIESFKMPSSCSCFLGAFF